MFHLVNKYGNVHKKVESERKRDELIAAGYRLAEEQVEEPAVDGVAPYNGPQQADEPQQVDDPLQMYTTEDDTKDAANEEGKQDATRDDVMSAFMATVAPAEVPKPKKGKAKKTAEE